MKNIVCALFVMILSVFLSFGQKNNILALIPQPKTFIQKNGSFKIKATLQIFTENGQPQNTKSAKLFLDQVNLGYGIKGNVNNKESQHSAILLKTNPDSNYRAEGYHLTVEKKKITIEGSPQGVFYGLQTLAQLVQQNQKKLSVPCCEIIDYPEFSWRGMHLDVSRHFFPLSFIKKYIDYLSMYKMNTFHWHLTDDQGWRIEIKKYPKLTQTGAWRNYTLNGHYSTMPQQFDSTRYGGFYTQEEIREVVDYAQKRFVTIVPEIEMPGHALAALSAYPELSCSGGHFEVIGNWGVFEDVFCTKEETFTFLQDVLSEVMDLFPGKYIHIGGDECPKERWKKCPVCQQRIKDEGLKDENKLQSYFIARIEKFVNSKSRSIIGWDEILEGGLAPNATVMSWRGTEGGLAAAKLKHNVVMAPGSHCYFDYYQGNPKFEPLAIGGFIPVEKVYQFDPIPAGLNPEENKYILGGQANVWTEYIPDGKQVEYMIFPRMCALSEALWTYPQNRDFESFKKRLLSHLKLYDHLNINYSKAMFALKFQVSKGKAPLTVTLAGEPGIEIRYNTDGSELTGKTILYSSPISISKTCLLQAGNFSGGKLCSPVLSQQFYVNPATGKNVTLTYPPHENYNVGGAATLTDGILGRIPWYGGEWLGFNGKNCEAILDLEKTTKISKVIVDVLNAESSWIYLPKSIEVFISPDGVNFTSVKKISEKEIVEMQRKMILETDGLQTRYLKIVVENNGKIPDGKPGAGYDAWLFVDEILVE
ncbi:MAG: glycoside hydrolase family 20 protein [Lentimicrobiaceae bacterium]|nr:glycoside hydrolase family 20 protein [Lentimicrobiaceae bacterium]